MLKYNLSILNVDQRCFQHWPDVGDVVDGPPPTESRCRSCIRKRQQQYSQFTMEFRGKPVVSVSSLGVNRVYRLVQVYNQNTGDVVPLKEIESENVVSAVFELEHVTLIPPNIAIMTEAHLVIGPTCDMGIVYRGTISEGGEGASVGVHIVEIVKA